MVGQLARAVNRFVATCPNALAVHDLVTKARVELKGDYLLDLYDNATLGKYTYTLIHGQRRVLGWDNAPHHPGLPNKPHHFHTEDGAVESSLLTGDPEHDIIVVASVVNAFLQSRN
jgi:hypothetical protein